MNRGIFGPWPAYKKVALFLTIVLGIVIFFISSIPLGIIALFLLIAASYIWQDLTVTDPTRGAYMPGTLGYKFACFFMSLKANLAGIMNVNVLGFGPPRQDDDHGFAPGLTPPTRLSAYYALLAAIFLSVIDFLFKGLHLVKIPFFITVPLSIIGWFLTFQVFLAVRSIQGDPEQVMGIEPKPQVIISGLTKEHGVEHKAISRNGAILAAVLVFITGIIQIAVKLPWVFFFIVIAIEVVVAFSIFVSVQYQKSYVSGWEERKERREYWDGVFGFLKPESIPTFLGESELPTPEEWVTMYNDPQTGEVAPYDPDVKIAVFGIPPHHSFSSFTGSEEIIQGSITDCKILAIAPVGDFNPLGEELIGSVGTQAFRIWYSDKEAPDLLDPNIDDRMRELVARARVINSLRNIRGIGECLYYQSLPVTTPTSPRKIISVQVVPQDPSVSIESFLSRIDAIQTALGVKWVRVMPSTQRSAPPGTVNLYIGEEPLVGQVDFINPQSMEQRRIDVMTWLYNFYSVGVRGTNGLPKYLRRGKTTEIVDKISFVLPDGLSVKDIQDIQEKLASTSGNQFLEINEVPPKQIKQHKPGKRLTRRELEELQEAHKITFDVIASKLDPLNRLFSFKDYESKILTGREPGVAKLDYAAGVMADDEIALDDWGSPSGSHLLVAGQSGSGKSVYMSSFILQLLYNNGPNELQFRMIEPKSEMQVYRNVDSVTHFVDTWTPDENFMANAADLMDDTVEEMNNRNAVMANHPKNPKSLSKAREIAIRESEENGTPLESHPLYMPYIVVIIEECATLFADVVGDEKEDQKRLLQSTVEIARKARSAGIYLVAATQYPTNASIPSVIRQQMRRVGMKCRNGLASQVVIDETGLENISIQGVGMLEPKGSNQYRKFRAFWVEEGDTDYGEHNDIQEILSQIPTKIGVTPAQMSGSGGSGADSFQIPTPDGSIFDLFANKVGGVLDVAIDEQKRTKDKTDKDFPES